jgi:hypothetical protein
LGYCFWASIFNFDDKFVPPLPESETRVLCVLFIFKISTIVDLQNKVMVCGAVQSFLRFFWTLRRRMPISQLIAHFF